MRFLIWILMALMLVSCSRETEKKRRTLGYKGEAKNNAFLAAQRFLKKKGKDVESSHGLNFFDANTSVIFLPLSSMNTVGRAKRLEDWVRDGGHLVVMMEGGQLGGNDFRIRPYTGRNRDIEEYHPGVKYLLDTLNIRLVSEWDIKTDDKNHKNVKKQSKGPSKGGVKNLEEVEMDLDAWEEMEEKDRALLGSTVSEIRIDGEVLRIHHWSKMSLEYEVTGDGVIASEAKEKKHRYLSVPCGEGRVTWLTDAHPLRNRFIGYADHAKLLERLVGLSRPGSVVFSKGEGDGFLSLLWRHFPLAVVAMLLLILFWLWQHLPRFGPLRDVSEGQLRLFSGQIRGVGQFFWRQKREDVMLEALRNQVKQSGGLGTSPLADSDDKVFDRLVEQCELSKEEVTEAMTQQEIREPGMMVRVIKNLQKMRNLK